MDSSSQLALLLSCAEYFFVMVKRLDRHWQEQKVQHSNACNTSMSVA